MELVFLVLAVIGIPSAVVGAWQLYRVLGGRGDPEVAGLERQVERIQRTLDEMKEAFNHYFGIASRPAEQLVATSDEGRLRLLAEATEAQRQHRYPDAARLLESCVRPDLPPEERVALHNLIGNTYMYMGRQAEARPHYQEVLAAADRTGDQQARAAALGNLGLVCTHRGDLDKAEEYHLKALAIDQEIGNRLGQANQLGNLGLVYADRGDLDKAEEYQLKALAIHQEIGDKVGEAADLGNLGLVYARRGEFDKAEDCQQKALAMDEEIGNKLGQAQDLGNLGNVYADRGEVNRAEEHHKKALAIDQEIGNRLGQANQLGNLGLLRAQRGNRAEALPYFREARRIFAEVGASAELKKTDELIRDFEAPSPPKRSRPRKERPPGKP